ncbi:unnamed protein product [Brugia pahangi]|uniref:Protein-export membrane protein SecF n=1 Tax=Brugia pahangi TaxID=6280 RepID=A0A0N4TF43_BRUPA|nr:unnamed protein product [Brugia pahangi]
MYDAWHSSYFGKRFAFGLAFVWYMFQDLENHYVFIDGYFLLFYLLSLFEKLKK